MRLIGGKLVVFSCLFGTTWAALEDKPAKNKLRRIIFPRGFVPIANKEYDVLIRETLTGIYVYKNESLTVCNAQLCNANDAALQEISQPEVPAKPKKKREYHETTMHQALRLAGLIGEEGR